VVLALGGHRPDLRGAPLYYRVGRHRGHGLAPPLVTTLPAVDRGTGAFILRALIALSGFGRVRA
jgi:hypothetical protein